MKSIFEIVRKEDEDSSKTFHSDQTAAFMKHRLLLTFFLAGGFLVFVSCLPLSTVPFEFLARANLLVFQILMKYLPKDGGFEESLIPFLPQS